MQIELLEIGAPIQSGKLTKMKLAYIRDGKKAERNLASVGKTKEVMQALQQKKPGDVVEIDLEKSADGEFWNWVGIHDVEKAAAAEVKSHSVGKSTYETPEERALRRAHEERKQVYIVRQSSIAVANDYLKNQGKKYAIGEVLDIARTLVSFVFATNGQVTVDESALEEARLEGDDAPLQDDIPF